jgi:hypothetical protein
MSELQAERMVFDEVLKCGLMMYQVYIVLAVLVLGSDTYQ